MLSRNLYCINNIRSHKFKYYINSTYNITRNITEKSDTTKSDNDKSDDKSDIDLRKYYKIKPKSNIIQKDKSKNSVPDKDVYEKQEEAFNNPFLL